MICKQVQLYSHLGEGQRTVTGVTVLWSIWDSQFCRKAHDSILMNHCSSSCDSLCHIVHSLCVIFGMLHISVLTASAGWSNCYSCSCSPL